MCLYVTPGEIQFASVVKNNSDKIILPTSPLDSLRNPKVTKTRAIPQHTNLDRVKLKGLEISIFCIAGMQRQKELAAPNYEYKGELLQIEFDLFFLSYHAIANRQREIG